MTDYEYLGRAITHYSLQELQTVLASLNASIARREEAAKHDKFKKMEFPPPNPAFLELKNEIELEIKNRNKNWSTHF